MKKTEQKSGLRPTVGERGLYAGALGLSTPVTRIGDNFSQRKNRCHNLPPPSWDIVALEPGFKAFSAQIIPADESCHKADTFSLD